MNINYYAVFFFFYCQSNLCCPYVHVWSSTRTCLTYQWQHSKETDASSPSRYQLLIPTSSAKGGTSFTPSFPMLGFGLAWGSREWCMLSQPLWRHMCSCPAVSRKHCFLVVTHHLWFFDSFHPLFHNNPWAFTGKRAV